MELVTLISAGRRSVGKPKLIRRDNMEIHLKVNQM
jgi:hypothetical protein